MSNTEKHTELMRTQALAFGMFVAKKQFEGRKGHGGNTVLAERHYSISQVAALLAASWEEGAEYAASRAPALLAQNKRLREALERVANARPDRLACSQENLWEVMRGIARAALNEKE